MNRLDADADERLFSRAPGATSRQKAEPKNPHAGGIWLRTALDADSKLMVAWRVGQRDLATVYDFTHDVADRLKNRVPVTTDGIKVYLEAVESAFNEDIDYAPLQMLANATTPTIHARFAEEQAGWALVLEAFIAEATIRRTTSGGRSAFTRLR